MSMPEHCASLEESTHLVAELAIVRLEWLAGTSAKSNFNFSL
jgi:hypothetical protein